MVDSRFTLKITDFGLVSIRQGLKYTLDNEVDAKRALWTAPELLREMYKNGGYTSNYRNC